MVDIVAGAEHIVGHKRRPGLHLARMVSQEKVAYVLHSSDCLNSGIELRTCVYSQALGRGIDQHLWRGYLDRPVVLTIATGHLEPLTLHWPEDGGETSG